MSFMDALAARFTFAHRVRCAAAILRRADADMIRLRGFLTFAVGTRFCDFTFAQRALRAATSAPAD